MSEPTALDHANAECCVAIAEKQNAIYAEAERLALATLGPGFTPWMRLSLLDSDYHRTGNVTPVAVALKAYRGPLRLSENSVYLRRMPDGSVKRTDNYEELFGGSSALRSASAVASSWPAASMNGRKQARRSSRTSSIR